MKNKITKQQKLMTLVLAIITAFITYFANTGGETVTINISDTNKEQIL